MMVMMLGFSGFWLLFCGFAAAGNSNSSIKIPAKNCFGFILF